MPPLPGLSAGGGMSLAGSSSATAEGGKIGGFTFSPNSSTTTTIMIIAVAIAAVFILKR